MSSGLSCGFLTSATATAADHEEEQRHGSREQEDARRPPQRRRLEAAVAQQVAQLPAEVAEVVLGRGQAWLVAQLPPDRAGLLEVAARASAGISAARCSVPSSWWAHAMAGLSPSVSAARSARRRVRASCGPPQQQRQRSVDGACDTQRLGQTALLDEALEQLEQQVDVLDGALGVEERRPRGGPWPARRPSSTRAVASPALSGIERRRGGFARSARASSAGASPSALGRCDSGARGSADLRARSGRSRRGWWTRGRRCLMERQGASARYDSRRLTPPGRALPSPGGAVRPRTDRAQRRGGRRALAGARRRLRGAGRGQRGGRGGRPRRRARPRPRGRVGRRRRAAGSATRATAGASWPSARASRSRPASRRCSPTWARSSTSGRAGRRGCWSATAPSRSWPPSTAIPSARLREVPGHRAGRGSARRCARGRTRARCARCGCSSRSTASPRRWPRASTAPTARARSRRCARTPTA